MKKLLILLLFSAGMVSCNSKKNMLIGKWEYNSTTSKDAGNSTVMVNSSGVIEFESDGTYVGKSDGTIIVLNKNIDINNVTSKGTWKLSEDELFLTKEMTETDKKEKMLDGFRDAGFSDEVVQLMEKFADKFSKDGGNISTDKIIKLDKNILILEIQGDMVDGEKTTYHKIE